MEVLLTYEHDGHVLQLFAYETDPSQPADVSCLTAPGEGRAETGPIALTYDGGAPILTARVAGENVAYLYTELLLKDPHVGRYYGPLAREHILAPGESEVRGVSHPVWDDPVEIAVRLHLSLPLLTDGVGHAFCSLMPTRYDSPDHRLSGLFTPADGAVRLQANLTLDGDGEMRSIVVHKEHGDRLLPHPLIPAPGDRFSAFVQVLTPPVEGRAWQVSKALSDPLTFSDRGLRAVVETAVPGSYLVGLVVQDMDGGLTRTYLPVHLPTHSR